MSIQPTSVIPKKFTIGSVPHIDPRTGKENFVVHQLRIYEDICKAYFTAQLIIEDQLNRTDPYLMPAVQVDIAFQPPNRKTYSERFRIYSIESKPKENDLVAGMIITLNLIGEEYYNDTQNTVMENFKNETATSAASKIHNQFIAENGVLSVTSSTGLIGQDEHPHQVLNMKPITAIHQLLDKAVSATWKTSAFTYFRNKDGYVIKPLEELLRTSPVVDYFIHKPASSTSLPDTLYGYNNIIHIRPMAPPSEQTAQGIRSVELDSLLKTSSFYDMQTGNYFTALNGIKKNVESFKALRSLAAQNISNIGAAFLKEAVKTQYGARMIFNSINEDRQPRQIDKQGPAGYNSAEEAFLAALAFTKKYWISVPIESGINVTIGKRINAIYPVETRTTAKTLFVARLIHEIQFKTPGSKTFEPVRSTTDMYCVEF